MRSQQEIDDQIAALPALKDNVPESGMMGNNHLAIDAAVEVLERRMSHDDIFDKWGQEACEDAGEDFDQTVLDGAIAAFEWRMGRTSVLPTFALSE
jgi:hypothetical protein